MLRTDDASAVAVIRDFLDDLSFAYMSYRVVPDHDSRVFPDFRVLHETLRSLSATYRFLFTVFRQGHSADESVLSQALPPAVFEAFAATGLLAPNERRQWRTPGLIIVPIEGLNLLVSIPPQYPTATTTKQPVYLGAESVWLTRAIPARLNRRRVLDICSGSGIQGLLCAARGASRVVGLEKSEEAVSISRFNVALNRMDDVVEIRHSDLFAALAEDEEFDFVISNPAFMPVMEDVDYPMCGTGGADGTRLLKLIFAGLPRHLAEEAEGVMFCNALGDQFSINFNRDVLAPLARERGMRIYSYVNDKTSIDYYVSQTLIPNIINTCPEVTAEQRDAKVAAWREELRRRAVPAEYVYGQILRFWKGKPEVGIAHLPVYSPHLTDPLLAGAVYTDATA